MILFGVVHYQCKTRFQLQLAELLIINLHACTISFLDCVQESVKWERLPLKFLRNFYLNPGERLQELEIPLRGMEIALTSTSSFPIRMLEAETKQGLVQLEEHISLTLKQIKNCFPRDSLTVPESNADKIMESLQTLQATIPTNHEDLPSFFFLFCTKLLQSRSLAKPITSTQQKESSTPCQQNGFFKSMWMGNWSTSVNCKRLMPAFKCSL